MTEITVGDWLVAFALTLSIETVVVVVLLAPVEPNPARRVAYSLFANLVTHPAVWFIFPGLGLSYVPMVTLAEIWAFGLEGLFYWLVVPKLGVRRAFVMSVAANATSYMIGLVLQATGVL
jgi:hypothetical protein